MSTTEVRKNLTPTTVSMALIDILFLVGDGRVVRWSWINFQVRGVLLVWIRVGQGPTALAVGAGWGCLDIFTLIYPFSFLSPSLWETTRYRLKYCPKGSLSPKASNQPTNFLVSFKKNNFMVALQYTAENIKRGTEYTCNFQKSV